MGLLYGETIDSYRFGLGKTFFHDGRVFNGEWEMNMMKKGEMSYLLADGSRIIKQETYNAQSDKYNRKNYNQYKNFNS